MTIPRLHAGPEQLVRDIVELFKGRPVSRNGAGHQPIYILSNPSDGFVYQNGLQELQAAAIVASRGSTKDHTSIAIRSAERFELSAENLAQPITTLSGGESVKLSLAKAHLLRAITEQMVVSSPLTWLSAENKHLFYQLVDDFGDHSSVILLIMAGENDTTGAPQETTPSKITFTVKSEGLSVNLGDTNNEYALTRTAYFGDTNEALLSPCLVIGDNGSGKSLFCKVLAGAQPYDGVVQLKCKENAGRARLIFQDAIAQTMARGRELLLHEPCCSIEHSAEKTFHELMNSLSARLATPRGQGAPTGNAPIPLKEMSLLMAKLNLIAYRISRCPPLIILDEPDWGIPRDIAIALVRSTIDIAHARDIPIVLVSHKPWWTTICNSILRIRRAHKSNVNSSASFEIAMAREK